MKRLYIGGLGHTVTEKDLKDRFGKFGEVSDVEIITRKDDQGAPLKTFGYININITDTEYKRCVGILNKSMWKGGTLLIQLAKESFLHRLAEERQQTVEKIKTPKIIPQEKILDSLKAAGVENFHMKAAVPGTEIPGHKDWVVSKFGRVLPVLNLKCKGKSKVFKYDPSKHCHNIKRLETADDLTSVSGLTWEMEGGDDEISKKRRGEFPEQKSCVKKPKVDLSLFLSSGINASAIGNKSKTAIQQNGLTATKNEKQKLVKKSICVFDSDADSEDEIRMMVAQEHSRNQKQTSLEEDDGNLEVVGDDFIVKSNVFWSGTEENGVNSLLNSSKDDEEYDSADTDEILTQRKTSKSQVNQDSPTKSNQNESDGGNEEESYDDDDDDDSVDSDYEAMMGNCYRLDLSLADLEQLAKNAETISDDETVEEPKEKPKTPLKKTGYNPQDILASLLGDDTPEKEDKRKKKNQATTSSLPAFIGTKDLFGGHEPNLKKVVQRIDCESAKTLKQDPKLKKERFSEDKSQPSSSNRPSEQKSKVQLKVQSTSKKVIAKESNSENDSSSEESESSDKSEVIISKTNKSKTPIKPKQTKLSKSSSSESSSEESESDEDESAKVCAPKTSTTQSLKNISETESKTVSANKSKTPNKPKQTKLSKSSSSKESDSDEAEDESAEVFAPKTSSTTQSLKNLSKTVSANKSKTPIKPKQTKPSTSSSDSSSEESETSDDEEESRTQPKDTKPYDSKKVESSPAVVHSTVVDAQKQQQDNQKRLAALEQRQREAEQQKKLIQGALSNIDTVNKSKRIVFDSDEEEDETVNKPEEQTTCQKKCLFDDDDDDDDSESDEDHQQASTSNEKENKPSGSKLFESEDEDEGAEDERFQIKPQFEGKAGEKLMRLQARFGTDSRFQIDSRFLESEDETEDQDEAAPKKDAEEELLEEKKKSLDILQSILHTNIQPQSTRKSKTFKDVSVLHYDPTREEHADFETKTEQPKKESKASRRKKREEAEKLPEVSKDIYFDVSVDFKEVFTTSVENQEEKETISWDKEDKETDDIVTPMEVSLTSNVEAQEDTSGGFKFSFFGDNSSSETTAKTDKYKIETLKGAKFSWQTDPRFQDSSSDEEGVDEVEEDQSASSKITEEAAASKKAFFFFCRDDERLKEGPGMFCRSRSLGDQRKAWEEKRMSLKEECRKKHRDAKRRQKPSKKT